MLTVSGGMLPGAPGGVLPYTAQPTSVGYQGLWQVPGQQLAVDANGTYYVTTLDGSMMIPQSSASSAQPTQQYAVLDPTTGQHSIYPGNLVSQPVGQVLASQLPVMSTATGQVFAPYMPSSSMSMQYVVGTMPSSTQQQGFVTQSISAPSLPVGGSQPAAVPQSAAQGQGSDVWASGLRMTMAETRRLANFTVDWSLLHGELPVFGKEAEDLILSLNSSDIQRAEVAGLAGEGEINRWKNVLTSCDPGSVEVEQRRRQGSSRLMPLRSLMNVKVSEHWSYKAKLLFRRLNVQEGQGAPLGPKDVVQGWVIQGIANWAGLDINELQPKHVILAFWRANKRVAKRTLRDDVQEARSHVRGRRVEISEFEVARDTWRAELQKISDTLFPGGDYSSLKLGKDRALQCDDLPKRKVKRSPRPTPTPAGPPEAAKPLDWSSRQYSFDSVPSPSELATLTSSDVTKKRMAPSLQISTPNPHAEQVRPFAAVVPKMATPQPHFMGPRSPDLFMAAGGKSPSIFFDPGPFEDEVNLDGSQAPAPSDDLNGKSGNDVSSLRINTVSPGNSGLFSTLQGLTPLALASSNTPGGGFSLGFSPATYDYGELHQSASLNTPEAESAAKDLRTSSSQLDQFLADDRAK